MDVDAFDAETLACAARRSSRRLLASTAACWKQCIMACLDIKTASVKGLTYQELAEATGEEERAACFTLPPLSETARRSLPGTAHCDESRHCAQCIKPGTGTKDSPGAFSLKLRKTTRGFGVKR
eukprot:8538312-Pyramimonas_sp.AAC.1